jgi:hypothetical protein
MFFTILSDINNCPHTCLHQMRSAANPVTLIVGQVAASREKTRVSEDG